MLNKDDLGSPVALIARMVQSSRILAGDLVKEGFLSSYMMSKLLDPACPKDVLRDVLMTVSNLARLSKVIQPHPSKKVSKRSLTPSMLDYPHDLYFIR